MNKLFFNNLEIGSLLFNRFTIKERLSSGNLGGVYLCTRVEQPEQLVALKILSSQAMHDKTIITAFEREVDLTCRVRHPNVIQALEFFQDEDFTAFTMEYIDGGTLADRLTSKKPLPTALIIDILSQLCTGLEAIHAAGIVHRDLKPENVLITSHGVVKIADFGISISDTANQLETKEHLIGTMNYLSPEYVERGHCDEQSDIYALGVIAYELMSGTLPFQGKSILETLTMRVRFDPVPPCLLWPDSPMSLSRIALKAMARDTAKRYQNMKEMKADLIEFASGLTTEALTEIPSAAADSTGGRGTLPNNLITVAS